MKRVREVFLCLMLCLLFSQQVRADVAELTDSGSSEEWLEEKLSKARQERRATEHAVEAMSKVWRLEQGGLQDGATMELLEDATEASKSVSDEKVKETLGDMAKAALIELQKPKTRFYGTCFITHYCNCSICCEQWAGGPTASGVMPTVGRTVAMDLPFGTQVEINGHVYTVEDRGVSGAWVDIYCDSHGEALNRGAYYAEVYIVE